MNFFKHGGLLRASGKNDGQTAKSATEEHQRWTLTLEAQLPQPAVES
jgi:hypothetical protein